MLASGAYISTPARPRSHPRPKAGREPVRHSTDTVHATNTGGGYTRPPPEHARLSSISAVGVHSKARDRRERPLTLRNAQSHEGYTQRARTH